MNTKTAMIAAVAIVIIIVLVAAAVALSQSSDDSGPDRAETPDSGDRVVGYYSYTCSYVDYIQENPFLIPTLPSPGNVFAKVDIRIHNIDSPTLTTSKLNFRFTADGITYEVDEVEGNSGFFADDIGEGETKRVVFYYEVPQGTSNVQLTWVGDENVQYSSAI